MAPTRRKPTKRKVTEGGIGTAADALSVDELRESADENGVFHQAEGSRTQARPASKRDGVHGGDAHGARFYSEAAPGREADAEKPGSHEDAYSHEGEADSPEECPRAEKRRLIGPVQIALIVILALLVVVEGGFCLARWGANDAADMQGRWYVNGSDAVMTITAETIVLADDVAYEYAIDEKSKTITYEFGIMEGAWRYRFSLDRTQLAIMDGSFTFMDTLTADISWTFEALVARLAGTPLSPGSGENVALLERAPMIDEQAPESDAPEASGDGASGQEGDAGEGSPGEAAGPNAGGGDASSGSLEDGAAGSASSNPADAFEVSDIAQDA